MQIATKGKLLFHAWPPAQMLKVMKLTAFFLLVLGLHVSAHGYAQKVNLDFRDVPLTKVIKAIQQQSDFMFLYNNRIIRKAGNVSVQVRNADPAEALSKSLASTGLTYRIVDKTIIIVPKTETEEEKVAVPEVRKITGTVTDTKAAPLFGVSVYNRSTKLGTSTDKNGNFSIDAAAGDLLEFTMVGYKKASHKITATETSLTVSLELSVSQLNDLVIIGYGSVRKKDMTGSVVAVDPKEVKDIPFVSIDNALAGKAAGVQITKTDGTPGGAVRIRVRGSSSLLGSNDPLYVIDGVPVQVQTNYINPGFDVGSPAGNDINAANAGIGAGMSAAFVNGLNSVGGLNIDDIESITILKDASATAIYGSKAANGVVIITTKRGKKDMKPRIMVGYYSTLTKPINPGVLNADQYKTLITESAKNDYDFRVATGRTITGTVDAIVNHPSSFFGPYNTNWLDLVTRNTVADNVQLSIQGGGSDTRYYSSIAYNNTPGVVLGTNYHRVSGKLNLENDIGKRFKFIANMDLGYIDQDISNGVYAQALRARPDYSPYDATGNFTNFADVGYSYQGFQNPLALTTSINTAKTLTVLGSLTGQYDFSPDLQFKSTVSLNMQQYNQRNYTPSYLDISNFYGNTSSNGGTGGNSNSRLANWFIENTLTYSKTFRGKHAVNLLAGTSYETRKTSFFSATGSGYPNDNILNSLSSAVTPLQVKGDDPSKPQSYLLSFYLRANYAFNDKYLFTVTGRADGSSKFGPDNKFGYFPSGAIAWRISQENFLKRVSWIDDIRLRGSYGLTGTQNIGDQMYRTLYSPMSYAGNSALVPTQLGNPAIKWETTRESDAGIDFSLFKSRLQGTFDYYHKQTDGVLLALPVTPSSSYSTLLKNVANIRNTGYEFSLQGDIIRTRNFRWNASVNVTWNKSLVTKLGDADLGQIGNESGLEYGNTAIIEGKPLGLIMGYEVTGLIKSQKELEDYKSALHWIYSLYILPYLDIGDAMFALDGDGFPENKVIASCAPKYYGGFTQGFTYKNMDLNFYFTFSEGGKLMWADYNSSLQFTGTSNANTVMFNRYTPDHTNTAQPRLILSAWNPASSLGVFNSSYVKLRTLTFNYRFNQAGWMRRAGVQTASVYLSATNVFTITNYPGNDPETSDDPYSVHGGYYDVSNYPSVKTYSLGVKLGF